MRNWQLQALGDYRIELQPLHDISLKDTRACHQLP